MKRFLVLSLAFFVSLLFAGVALDDPSVAIAVEASQAQEATQGFDCADVTQIPQSECEALVTFYYATGGDGWLNDDGWLATNTPCEWFGITCSAGHVTGLTKDDALVGNIPPEVAHLSHLRLLVLRGAETGVNGLSGIIPPELGTLSQLETFKLGHNLDVSIPPELGNLSSLHTLQITAAVAPTDAGELLDRLLRNGDSTLPPELGNLSNLQSLQISHSVGGTIPPELGNLANLEVLNVGLNALTGSVPPELGNLTNLTHLRLGTWHSGCSGVAPMPSLSGPLPAELGNLYYLHVLDVSCQSLDGPMPMTFTNLVELEHLHYENNRYAFAVGLHLCEPESLKFQLWIDGVPSVEPSPGIICGWNNYQLYLPVVMR